MSYTSTEQKAIGWYSTTNSCRIVLSIKNRISFQKIGTSKLIECDLSDIVKEYTIYKDEVSKEMRRLKQVNSLINKRNIVYKEQYK
jgi:hypothetical protein